MGVNSGVEGFTLSRRVPGDCVAGAPLVDGKCSPSRSFSKSCIGARPPEVASMSGRDAQNRDEEVEDVAVESPPQRSDRSLVVGRFVGDGPSVRGSLGERRGEEAGPQGDLGERRAGVRWSAQSEEALAARRTGGAEGQAYRRGHRTSLVRSAADR